MALSPMDAIQSAVLSASALAGISVRFKPTRRIRSPSRLKRPFESTASRPFDALTASLRLRMSMALPGAAGPEE
jgi:hypothetical protein